MLPENTDYGLGSQELCHIARAYPFYEVPCKVHIGIKYIIHAKPHLVMADQLVRPKAMVMYTQDDDFPVLNKQKISWEKSVKIASHKSLKSDRPICHLAEQYSRWAEGSRTS